MSTIPDPLRESLVKHGQAQVLDWWSTLDDTQRQHLLHQLKSLDLAQLRELFVERDKTYNLPTEDRIAPIPVQSVDSSRIDIRAKGEALLTAGQVAAILVAGGQGSRLGFEHPKGMFAIGPVSHKTLFQIHAEKVLALSRRHGKPIPLLIMTSPATHDETVAFFKEHQHFGLSATDVHFFQQGTMPALDMATGQLLRDAPGQLFTSPNGHGGTLLALSQSGLLAELKRLGIRHVYYFQVDNPLIKVCDPWFLGYHLEAQAQVSAKIIPKEGPTDKLGNLVLVDGRCSMIEYSDLPESLARQTDANGRLRIWAGSPAIHVFELAFLEQLTAGRLSIPFHIARKKVPYLDAAGTMVQPKTENALKFEMFIFDVLPLADRWAIVETSRCEEFMPLKNASGADSPATVKQAMSDLAADWLAAAGVIAPRGPDGHVAIPIEISPLYALDSEELKRKIPAGMVIDKELYLS